MRTDGREGHVELCLFGIAQPELPGPRMVGGATRSIHVPYMQVRPPAHGKAP